MNELVFNYLTIWMFKSPFIEINKRGCLISMESLFLELRYLNISDMLCIYTFL